jgi:hypothetical protein
VALTFRVSCEGGRDRLTAGQKDTGKRREVRCRDDGRQKAAGSEKWVGEKRGTSHSASEPGAWTRRPRHASQASHELRHDNLINIPHISRWAGIWLGYDGTPPLRSNRLFSCCSSTASNGMHHIRIQLVNMFAHITGAMITRGLCCEPEQAMINSVLNLQLPTASLG